MTFEWFLIRLDPAVIKRIRIRNTDKVSFSRILLCWYLGKEGLGVPELNVKQGQLTKNMI